jgi:hypothetical protein
MAELLGGEVRGGEVLCPGPSHSAADRSLSVKPDPAADHGFVVHSFSGDDAIVCRDHVRKKLGLAEWKPRERKAGRSKAGAKPWSPIIARHVYKNADGTPYLQVCRTLAKTFFQNKWNGQMWVTGKPDGPKVPYMLPELLAAPPTAKVHICEGEKDADALVKLGFVATTNSEGAANWTDDLNEYFRDRHVFIHEDNDDEGRKRVQRIARVLDGIAASVRVIRLPGLPPKGDVSDWLENDPSGARLVKHCDSVPIWEPPAETTTDERGDDKDHEDDGGLLGKMKKQADVLIELASSAELFLDRDDVGYARFEVNAHNENWPIRSKGFKRWLVRAFYENTQTAPSSEAVSSAMSVLEARAHFDAPEHDVRVRVAGCDGRIYIDLADRDWRAIELSESGWRIIDNPPVYFRRSAGMKPLPEPAADGSLDRDLRPLLNVKTERDFVLAVAWLLAALRHCGPYPVLGITGEQGSAKSWLAKLLRALVDDNSVPLRALPRDERDVFIAARNSQVLAYDNVSGLPDWLSDTFCRLATGGGFSTRELYTDQDEVLFASTRPILLNGIDDIATRPDLADRSIALMLAAISDDKRKQEEKLWAEFESKRPRILGALLDAVSHGLRTLPDVHLDRLPRMADFAAWVTACEGALWKPGTFMAAYTSNIEEAVEVVLDADQIATALRSYIDLDADFQGTASDLLKALNRITPESQTKAKGWPKRPNTLSNILRRIAPPLRKIGIDIGFDRDKRQKTITVTRSDRARKTSSSPSSSLSSKDGNGLDRAEDRHTIVTASPQFVTGDDPGDDPCGGIVTDNPLPDKGNDDPCVDDDLLHTPSGGVISPEVRQQRIDEVTMLIEASGLAPKDFFFTQPISPDPKDAAAYADWQTRERTRKPIVRRMVAYGLTAHDLTPLKSESSEDVSS